MRQILQISCFLSRSVGLWVKNSLSFCLNLVGHKMFLVCTIPLYMSNGAYHQRRLGFSGCNCMFHNKHQLEVNATTFVFNCTVVGPTILTAKIGLGAHSLITNWILWKKNKAGSIWILSILVILISCIFKSKATAKNRYYWYRSFCAIPAKFGWHRYQGFTKWINIHVLRLYYNMYGLY